MAKTTNFMGNIQKMINFFLVAQYLPKFQRVGNKVFLKGTKNCRSLSLKLWAPEIFQKKIQKRFFSPNI